MPIKSSVFPTCVGVFLVSLRDFCRRWSLPHMRGGVSVVYITEVETAAVFPTCVGVFLKSPSQIGITTCLPHMRGGVSIGRQGDECRDQSSPHAWGCFQFHFSTSGGISVFPTCVGVFLLDAILPSRMWRLPHMRGGVSSRYPRAMSPLPSSPHAWGCF